MDTGIKNRVEAVLDLTGKWHWWIVVLLSLTKFPVIWSLVSFFFLAPKVSFYCAGCPNSTCTDCSGLPCTSWVYSTSPFASTIISEWDLVCERSHLVNLTQVVFMIGVIVGHTLFGLLADWSGRKGVVVWSGLGLGMAGALVAFLSSYHWFLVGRALQGLAAGGSICTVHVMCAELLNNKSRCTLGAVPSLCTYLGTSLAALLAFLARDWRSCLLATSLPSLLHFFYFWLIPESPRWLVMKGRLDEASKVVDWIVAFNGISEPTIQKKMEELQGLDKKEEVAEDLGVLDLLRSPTLRWRSLNVWISMTLVSACYYGLAQFLTRMSDDVFTNMGISGLLALPGCLLATYLLQKVGRRPTQFVAHLVCTACCFVLGVLSQQAVVSRSWFAVIGSGAVAVTFFTIVLYSNELFPTLLRNSALGIAASLCRLGNMFAPYILSFEWKGDRGSALVFTVLSCISAVLTALLPETLGHPLPSTLQEAIDLPYSWKKNKTSYKQASLDTTASN